MRSCKKAGTGCFPPPAGQAYPPPACRSRSSSPATDWAPRYAQAAPLVTPCLPDRRDRLKGDALVHRSPVSAAYRRPATARAGHRPRGRPGAVPVPQCGRTGGKADQHLPGASSTPRLQDANPVRGRRDQQGLPAHLTPRCRDPGTSIIPGISAIHTVSTERGQLSAFVGGYPPAYSQPVHRLPDVTRGTPGPASPHVIS